MTDRELAGIPGWFDPPDFDAFRVLLNATMEQYPEGGDLAELGAYLGRSAVLIGAHLRPGEVFTVIDLFQPHSAFGGRHPPLSRAAFEENYLSVHTALPAVITGYSHSITDHAAAGHHRFVHIDASHRYDDVVLDLEAAARLLLPDGIVVLDDYRSEHTPGVAAAAWRYEGLRPFLLTPMKMYATWGDAKAWRGALVPWLESSPTVLHEAQQVGGDQVIRVWIRPRRARALIPPLLLPALSRIENRPRRSWPR